MGGNVYDQADPQLRLQFQRGYLQTALRILHRAWPAVAADSRVTTSTFEDPITKVLRREMERVKSGMSPPPRMRFERESQSDAVDDDTATGLIDILVGYTWEATRYLAIECKRIESTKNALARKYVREGVNRFVTGKYSVGHALGGMVGYVICGDTTKCIERIKKQLEKESATVTGYDTQFGWNPDENWVPGETLYETRHQQKIGNNVIQLVHSFLELT